MKLKFDFTCRRIIYSLVYIFFPLLVFPIRGESQGSLKDKKVLFVYGGWDGHNPKGCRDLFVPWLKSEGAVVTTSDKLDVYTDQAKMDDLDLIIQIWTMGKISKDQADGLLNAVRNGTGIAGWHGGLGDAFRGNLHYQWMIGGQFMEHPGGIIDYTVNIAKKKDEITKGLKDFKLHTEQYYMLVDPNLDVLATTTFSGEHEPWTEGHTMPVVWKKHFGKGRVFYCNLGHKMDDFDVPEVLTMIKRGIVWASKSY